MKLRAYIIRTAFDGLQILNNVYTMNKTFTMELSPLYYLIRRFLSTKHTFYFQFIKKNYQNWHIPGNMVYLRSPWTVYILKIEMWKNLRIVIFSEI